LFFLFSMLFHLCRVLRALSSLSSSCGSLLQSSSSGQEPSENFASCAQSSRNNRGLVCHLSFGGRYPKAVFVVLAVKRPSLDGSGARLSAQVLIGCVESSGVCCRKLIFVARL
jgi:hypothetical protein